MSDRIIGDETYTARKPHRCDHCCQEIKIGERYRRIRGVWEGTAGTFRAHVECQSAAKEMHKMQNLRYDEGILLNADVQPVDHEWLLAEYPIVADRLGITSP